MTGKSSSVARALGTMLVLAVLVHLVSVGTSVSSALAAPADHLILSDVLIKTRGSASQFGSPHITVTNPTDTDLDLSLVYLTDATTVPNAIYYNLPLGNPAEANPGGGNGGDFHARFPEGYILAAGDALSIALMGSEHFTDAYGHAPDFELFEDGNSPDQVPEMVEAFPGSINAGAVTQGTNNPVLSDVGESLVLYSWDGVSDLVQDLDYLAWGHYEASLIDKTDVTVGSSTYLADTPVGSQDVQAVPGFRAALRRLSDDEGTETLVGGNGITGHDETSENLNTTWDVVDVSIAGHNIPAAPASWHPAAAIVTNVNTLPGVPVEGQDVQFELDAVSYSSITSVSFRYTVNGGTENLVMAALDDGTYKASVSDLVEDDVLAWYAVVENAAGATMTYPSAAPRYSMSLTIGPMPPPGSGAEKLLVTEVCVDPWDAEFVEIHNPNDFLVNLSDYYLTDAIYYGSSGAQLYWQIAAATVNRDAVGGGFYNDFHARFPDGFVIEAGQTIVIAVRGSEAFHAQHGIMPDIELYEDGAADNIPEMRSVFNIGSDNSIVTRGSDDRGYPELEEYWGESVILYHYAQGDDFVTDIDVVMWRHTQGNFPFTFDKTGVVFGSHTYLPDTAVDDQISPSGETGVGESYTRVVSDEAFQTGSGSNGVDGRDETSENLELTIQIVNSSPGSYTPVEIDLDSPVSLDIEAKTIIPTIGEAIQVNFSTNSSFETKLRVFDLEGRVVRTIYETRRDGAGGLLSATYWDGRNDSYELVKAGTYILHLQAVDPANGETYTETAPVVVATRLSR